MKGDTRGEWDYEGIPVSVEIGLHSKRVKMKTTHETSEDDSMKWCYEHEADKSTNEI